MAENQRERWYFTKEQIFNTPSRKCGIDYDKEISYRQQAANLIQDMGQRLQVSQLCINTAIVYMHRFYVYHSFTKFHRNQMAACALFLAAKVEEQPRKLEHVIRVAHMCLNRDHPPLDVRSEQYAEQAQELILNENILLQALGFDVAIDHPHTHVVRCCQLVRASKDLAQTSYFMATNSLHLTVMCLQLKPTVVACVCIHLVCKWSNWEIPRSSEGREWFWYVDHTVTLEQLEELTAEFLTIFKNSQSRLKRRVMQHGQGAAAALLPLGPSSEPHHKPSSTSRSDDREQRKDVKERMPGQAHPSSRPSSSSLSGSQQQHRPSSSSDPQQRSRPPVIDPKAASSSSSRPPHHHHHHHQQNKPSSHSSSKPLPPPGSSAVTTNQTSFSSSTSSTSVSTSISSSSKPSSSSSSRSHMDPNQMPKQSSVPPLAPPSSSSKAVPGRMPLFNSDWGGSSDTASKSSITGQSGQSALSAALGFGSQESTSDGGFQLNDSGWDLQFGAEPPSLSPTSALENMLNAQNVPSQTHQQRKPHPSSSSSFTTSSTSSSTVPSINDAHLHVKKEKSVNMPVNPYGSSSAVRSVFDVGDDLLSAGNSSRVSSHQQHQPHPQQQQPKPPLPSTPIAPGHTTEQDIKNILSQALPLPLPLESTKSWPGPTPHAQNANHPTREKISTKSLFSPPSEHSQPASVKTQEFSVKEEIRIADAYGHTKRRSTTSMTTTTTTIDMSALGSSTLPPIPTQPLPKPISLPTSSAMLNSTLEAPPMAAEKASSVSPSHKSDKKKKKKEKHKHKEKDKSKDKEGGEEKKHKKHKNKDKEKEKESKKKAKDELPPLVNNETPKLKITIPKTKLAGLDATPSGAAAVPIAMTSSDTPVKLKIPKQKFKTENGETPGGSGGDLKLKISLGSAAAASADTRKRHLDPSSSSSQFPGAPSMKMPRMDGPPSMGSLNSRSNGAGSQDRTKAPPTRPSSSSKVNSSSSAKAGWPGNGGGH